MPNHREPNAITSQEELLPSSTTTPTNTNPEQHLPCHHQMNTSSADFSKYWQLHELTHNGQHIKLRTFSQPTNHTDDRWIRNWYIIRPDTHKAMLGPFSKEEADTAKDIAADYFSFGPAK